ncbi:hypothetical protein DM01DRAFT_1300393 [Hesseltinella vesiculosa]|uniref:Cleavage/polyadenylation specificity factor A subunit C-terminal domain-containing protein n=1 Tax=Hesseltinella vesiculosa TaxID=101127 RepID=A0A1X2GSY5_9FUNG|nr:hypothetical protein DM01DRAFT_1300393 [Hesseltinella vesiculosa]
MSAYTIHKELFPPQTVEHVERAYFTDPQTVNVIVAKDSLLQVYRFTESASAMASTDTDDALKTDPATGHTYPSLNALENNVISTARLELITQFKLQGSVADMGIIRTCSPRGNQGCDSLLLAFDDAKMSLLEWSPETNTIVTVSLHFYERDDLRNEFINTTETPSLHVDPQQRCAVLNFYNDKLAVLPFRQRDQLDDDDEDINTKRPFKDSFIIDLSKVHKPIKRVIQVTFLSDYYEPILAILYQTQQTWTGQMQEEKDTAGVVVVSLDLTENLYPVIYTVDKLPYDSFQLLALPKPVHGMMVVSPNAVLHLSQGSPGVGTAVNGYTKQITSFHNMKYDQANVSLGVMLDGARALYLGNGVAAIFLQNGDWLLVKFVQDGNKVVSLQLVHCSYSRVDHVSANRKNKWIHPEQPIAVIPTCVTNVKQGQYFFLGSRVGDSLLIQWQHNPRYRSSFSEKDFTFRVCDQLVNTGPIVDMAIGNIDGDTTIQKDLRPDLDLVCCSGYGNNGGLSIFRRHIKPFSHFYSDQSDCQAIWSIKCSTGKSDRITELGPSTIDVSQQNDLNLDQTHDKLLVISMSNNTKVLKAGESLEEMENSGFYTRGPTVKVATILDQTRIVQVHEKGIYQLTPEGKRLEQVTIRDSRVMEAAVHDPYVLLLLENKTIHIYQLDDTNKLTMLPLPSHLNSPKNIDTATIFADTSGIFSSIQSKLEAQATAGQRRSAPQKRRATDALDSGIAPKKQVLSNDMDDIDMDLYGDDDEDKEPESSPAAAHPPSLANPGIDDDMDDDLYGDDTAEAPPPDSPPTNGIEVDANNVSIVGGFKEISQMVTLWCTVYTDNDAYTVFSLPDFKELFHVPRLSLLPELLTDQPSSTAADASAPSNPLLSDVKIRELLLTNIGKDRKDPYLVLRTSTNDVVIYKAFAYVPNESDETNEPVLDPHRLGVRFSRIQHDTVSHYRVDQDGEREAQWQAQVQRERMDQDNLVVELFDDDQKKKKKKKKHIPRPRRLQFLTTFTDVAGYTGVFVAGRQPLWLMASSKSFVRVHPMKSDHPILAFSQFHNVNCRHGFITIDTNSRLRFCTLPDENYDMDWLVKKVPLGRTVHKIRYHPEMCVYAVLVSQDEPIDIVHAAPPPSKPAPAVVPGHTPTTISTNADENGSSPPEQASSPSAASQSDQPDNDQPKSDQPEPPGSPSNASMVSQQDSEYTPRDPGAFLPMLGKFSLLLISPVTWETVDEFEFDTFDHGVSLECMSLESQQTTSGRKSFIVLGTGVLRGEDIAMRGSIFVFEIIEVVPELDNPQTNHKFKLLKKEDVKGSVSSMCEVSGHIAASIGSKVFVYSFEDNESLVGVAFIDVQIYVTCMQSIKNYILLGDVQRSVWFLGFQLEPTKLVLLGKDYQNFEVAAVNFVINDKALYLMVCDAYDNMDIYQYAPYHLQSISGQKLIRRGDYHIGSQVRTMIRMPKIIVGSNGQYVYSNSAFCLCGSYTGSIGVFAPLPEKTFKRLHTLYSQLVNSIPHVAGLNPRAYRYIKGTKQRLASNRNRAVLDGGILSQFVCLPVDRQTELTRQIGSTTKRIMEDIVDTMNISIDHF